MSPSAGTRLGGHLPLGRRDNQENARRMLKLHLWQRAAFSAPKLAKALLSSKVKTALAQAGQNSLPPSGTGCVGAMSTTLPS